MNVLSIYVVNEHILSLMEDAVTRKMAHGQPTGPSLRDRIASAAAGLRRLAGNPTPSEAFLPRLEDYPYRG